MDLQNEFWSDFYTYLFHLLEIQMGKSCIPNKRWRNPVYSNSLFSHFMKRFKLLQYNPLLIFFIHILLFCFQSVSSQSWDGIIVTQSNYQSLQAIKHELIDPKGVLRSWNDTGIGACSGKWAGIKCAKGQVIVIQLPWRGLGGRISEHIGELTALRKLSLHDNSIGGMVPTSLGFLPNLRGVQLFNNRFAGSIPASIGSCPLLQNLDLSNNSLTGAIPTSLANSSRLYRLNLSFNALSGPIPIGLTRSHSLTLLSLHYNNLSGSLPNTWGEAKRKHLYRLKSLTLDHNFISGSIPVSLSELDMLEELSLSNNQMSGIIPSELGTLSRLRTLDLSNNAITGDIPPSLVDLTNLTSFNVSYNKLLGSVPFVLSRKFDSSSFQGNVDLCGYSVSTPCPSPPPSPNSSQTLPPSTSEISTPRRHRLSTKGIIMIVSGAILALVLLLSCLLVCCLIRKKASSKATMGRTPTTREKGAHAMEGEVEAGGETGGKLVHFDGPLVFTADDLLCATAEIMGKSTYGTVYKATLEDGSEVAVKRLREKITKNQREFEVEVNLLGKIRHDNLLALRAYYLGPKGEKLLVFDYMPRGSLAAFLHARGPDTLIDWPTRMNIIVGVARGLNYLHTNENMVHGNLTAANILLDEQTNPKISDYGLSKLMTTTPNTNVVATAAALGYRAPELPKLKKANTKTDVYSLGVIMLELLTGKSPDEVMDGVDLPQWVASIVKEEWTNEVFDLELMRDAATTTTGDELLNTLKLALHCVDPSPAARPDVQQILNQLEEIKPEVGVSFGDDGAGDSTGAPSSTAD